MAEGDKLDVDYTEVEEALSEMRSAAKDFGDAGSSAFQVDCENMEPMNSDFIGPLSDILKRFPGWYSKDMMEHLEGFCGDAETIMKRLKATDEAHDQNRLEGGNG
ncbi:MAG: hypothetical protein J6K53_17445 [Roseburia sp.]|nr:hypothetical protein [Roseburia sp.]